MLIGSKNGKEISKTLINEIQKLIELLGGNKETVMTYAGIDDIMMTCTSSQSRNYTMGSLIGCNKSTEEIENYYKETYEKEGFVFSFEIEENIELTADEGRIDQEITNLIHCLTWRCCMESRWNRWF